MKSTLRFMLSLLWIAYFTVLAFFVAGSFLANPELTLNGRFKTFITQSGSMVPTIQVGDLIFVDTTVKRQPFSGEIITFKDKEGHTVTHRVVHVEGKDNQIFFTTKGDNNEDIDPDKITKENVIGFYKARLPYIGYLVVYLRKPAGLILLLLIPVILTALGEVLKDEKKTKDKKESEKSDKQLDDLESEAPEAESPELKSVPVSRQELGRDEVVINKNSSTQAQSEQDLNHAQPRKLSLDSQEEARSKVKEEVVDADGTKIVIEEI